MSPIFSSRVVVVGLKFENVSLLNKGGRSVKKCAFQLVCRNQFVHTSTMKPLVRPALLEKAKSTEKFKFTNYDCIGFDLDNTLARYKVGAMIDLEYDIMSRYLVKKGYSAEHLLKPLDHEFIIKGLIIDDVRGNLLRVGLDGTILQASHGSTILNDEQILKYYPNRHWTLTDMFVRCPLATWDGIFADQMRTLLDYYDICVSCIFARCVDSIDEMKGEQEGYDIWHDLLETLVYMFNRDHFRTNKGEYFPALKRNPEKYYYRCSDRLINWLKELKASGKILFLITGSHVDFASHTAANTLGPDWRSLFDIVICFAKKPGFFSGCRKFYAVRNNREYGPILPGQMVRGGIYTYGNYTDLRNFLKDKSNKLRPKCLYIGDNLVQDIYAPNVYTDCDTVTICEELEAEGKHGHTQWHPDEQFLVSTVWGSYFHCKHTQKSTIWYYMMKLHSRLCVPSLEYVSTLPIDHEYEPNVLDDEEPDTHQ